MLIVIVIIGILASALIPRLNSARGRANDTARKAALQQVSAVMVSYSIDHGVFPGDADKAYALNQLKPQLDSAGITTIPTDPTSSRSFGGIADKSATTCSTVTSWGQYGYITIKKNGISKWWFVLIAWSETLGGANTVAAKPTSSTSYTPDGCIIADSDYDSVIICKSVDYDPNNTDIDVTPCLAQKNTDVLRYIYKY